MRASTRIWLMALIALGALALLPTTASAGDEAVQGIPSEEICLADEAPEPGTATEGDPITLEELEQLFGAHRVCNVPCGYPWSPDCTTLCGYGAGCYEGYCLYW